MIATATIGAAIGLGSMAYGMYEKEQGKAAARAGYEEQQRGAAIQAEAARQTAGISKEQAASSVDYAGRNRDLNILASQQSIAASNQSTALSKAQIGEQRYLEAQRQQAMELDARRNQMEIIRNQQRGRALALTAATAQGAGRGSGLQGGYGQVSGQSGVNMLGVQQNLEIGRNTFAANNRISDLRVQAADLENAYAVQRANNQTAQSNLMYDYAVTNAGFQTRQADIQTYASSGQGMINSGAGQVNMGQMQIASGNSFMQAGPSIFSAGQSFNQLFGGPSSNLTSLFSYPSGGR